MAEVMRPDGTIIHYEVYGEGNSEIPLLLFAPGGVNSQIEFWQRSIINPIDAFSDEFTVIGMDQRHCGQSKTGLMAFDYDEAMKDQIAVLNDLGVPRAHVMGGCIGCAYALRLADQAPARVAGVVMQDPVGLDETNSPETFYDMFNPTIRLCRAEGLEAVIEAAQRDPIFMQNNEAGPFAQRIHDEPLFADAVRSIRREGYIALVVEFRDGMWPQLEPYFAVNEVAVQRTYSPMLVIPGADPFHPTGIGHRICNEAPNARCLDVDARSAEKLPATLDAIRQFLRDCS
ncbi:MAG: alpha/beta hydrolase [Chloroflexi bacterium]|nr:alpha/beta hydrolase [Chloroflexota bacterium]MXX81006.1 alpha/beta hydrolase [Chloroflexota bacterium]MYD17110.1 alpha/beta hydrolase [Chloroflexota bacterium]MYF21689.1 alpha/beta hydrolase [Chloroflexota bacterium]